MFHQLQSKFQAPSNYDFMSLNCDFKYDLFFLIYFNLFKKMFL